jgi:hypothetical protein
VDDRRRETDVLSADDFLLSMLLVSFSMRPGLGVTRKAVPLELPDNLSSFVDRVVDSFVTWDILVGFAKRPGISGTPADFSTLLGRPVAEVSASLQLLAEKKLLKRTEIADAQPFFELSTDSPSLDDLKHFAAFNETQENRLKVLSRLLQRGIHS